MRTMRLIVRRMRAKAAKHPLFALLSVLAFLVLGSILLIWLLDEDVTSLREAVFMVLPPFLGQVFENRDVAPATAAVWIVGLIASICSIAVITALLVNRFFLVLVRGGAVTTRTDRSDHVVICGWNAQGEGIVTELLTAEPDLDVVILASQERRPVTNDAIEFVSGDPTQDRDLSRAGIERARSAIVLTDFHQNPNEADARALLITLAIETANPSVHTCVQIVNSANRRHFERAGADEMICLDQIGGNLAVASALHRGVAVVVSELLTFNWGSEFYRVAGASVESLSGKSYLEASHLLAGRGVVLVGVEVDATPDVLSTLASEVVHAIGHGGNRIIVVNPRVEYHIRANDALFCVGRSADDCKL